MSKMTRQGGGHCSRCFKASAPFENVTTLNPSSSRTLAREVRDSGSSSTIITSSSLSAIAHPSLVLEREPYNKGRPFTRLALNRNCSPVRLDDLLCNPKAQSQTLIVEAPVGAL